MQTPHTHWWVFTSFYVCVPHLMPVLLSRLLVSASQDGKLIIWDSYTTNKVWLLIICQFKCLKNSMFRIGDTIYSSFYWNNYILLSICWKSNQCLTSTKFCTKGCYSLHLFISLCFDLIFFVTLYSECFLSLNFLYACMYLCMHVCAVYMLCRSTVSMWAYMYILNQKKCDL